MQNSATNNITKATISLFLIFLSTTILENIIEIPKVIPVAA